MAGARLPADGVDTVGLTFSAQLFGAGRCFSAADTNHSANLTKKGIEICVPFVYNVLIVVTREPICLHPE